MDKCEGCGLEAIPHIHPFIKIRVTNGVLTLCRTCLDDVNRKSPLLAQVRADALEEAAKRLDDELYRDAAYIVRKLKEHKPCTT